MNRDARLACILSLGLVGACTATVKPAPVAVQQPAPPPAAPPVASSPQPPPPPPSPPSQAGATDPHFEAAVQALGKAKGDLASAAHNKGGHRVIALAVVGFATGRVKVAEKVLAAHQAGPPEPPAQPEPIQEKVPGGKTQPRMAAAVDDLREARKQLDSAAFHCRQRAVAAELTQVAIDETLAGMWAGAPHPRKKMTPRAMKQADRHMEAAITAIEQARATLTSAEVPKSGHRYNALMALAAARDEAFEGVRFAAAHKKAKGLPVPPAPALPVTTAVKGGDQEPQIAAAIVDLREAQKQLHGAGWDNGHRTRAWLMVAIAQQQLRAELAQATRR